MKNLPVIAQIVGGGVLCAGVYLMAGLAWTLLLGGLVLLIVGTVFESVNAAIGGDR